MKRGIVILFLLLLFKISLYADVEVLKGQKNEKYLKNANPIYVLLTFKGTLIYDEPIDVFIKDANEEGFDINRKEIIADYKEEVADRVKRKGKKYGMKVIRSMKEAKKGYVFILNYKACIPVPPMGYNGDARVAIYKVGNKKQLMSLDVDNFSGAGSWLPRFCFGKNGKHFIDQIISYLNKVNRKYK